MKLKNLFSQPNEQSGIIPAACSSICHEVRTPLVVIKTALSFSKKRIQKSKVDSNDGLLLQAIDSAELELGFLNFYTNYLARNISPESSSASTTFYLVDLINEVLVELPARDEKLAELRQHFKNLSNELTITSDNKKLKLVLVNMLYFVLIRMKQHDVSIKLTIEKNALTITFGLPIFSKKLLDNYQRAFYKDNTEDLINSLFVCYNEAKVLGGDFCLKNTGEVSQLCLRLPKHS